MRCHEARQRLSQLRGVIPETAEELWRHLAKCPACAAEARSERALHRDFQAVKSDDLADGVPWSILQTRVEAEAAGLHRKENSVMSALANNLKRKPRLTVTLAAFAVVVLLAALIPFRFEETVGYQVAFAGVNRDLAMDNQKVELLLETLGCKGAVADVSDCEATCRLVISELDSERDVKVLKAAFNEMGNCVLEGVDEVSAEKAANLFHYAEQMVFKVRPRVETEDDGAINEFVVNKLNCLASDTSGPFSIFFSSCDGDDRTVIDIAGAVCLDSNKLTCDSITIDKCIPVCAPGCVPGPNCKVVRIDETADGSRQATLVDENGERHVFDLNDPEDIKRMNQFDLQLDMLHHDGTGDKQFFCQPLVEVKEEDDGIAAAKEGNEPELPEGYSLAQNFPNPFNPTTTLSYYLPEASRVTLDIYNMQGQRVKTLVDQTQSAGRHEIEWSSTDDAGNRVASGVYVYRLTAGDFTESKKMTLVK